MALWAPRQGSVGLVKGRSIIIDGYHNPNNVRKGGGGGGGDNGHVRIVFQVKTLVNQISMFLQYVNAMFELLFWRKPC